jgi:hypothetical protein
MDATCLVQRIFLNLNTLLCCDECQACFSFVFSRNIVFRILLRRPLCSTHVRDWLIGANIIRHVTGNSRLPFCAVNLLMKWRQFFPMYRELMCMFREHNTRLTATCIILTVKGKSWRNLFSVTHAVNSDTSQPTFRNFILPPSSRSKNMPSYLLPATCYSLLGSILNLEDGNHTCFETCFDCRWTTQCNIIISKSNPYIAIAGKYVILKEKSWNSTIICQNCIVKQVLVLLPSPFLTLFFCNFLDQHKRTV